MAKNYEITIKDGIGTQNILNGAYNVTADILGYDNSTIDPKILNIVDGTNEYELKISGTASLTVHVSEDGTASGTSVVGASFYRTDQNGNVYGNLVTTDLDGNATFNNLPYSTNDDVTIYIKQNNSDDNHEFDSSVKNIVMNLESITTEIVNSLPATRTIKLTDSNYDGLSIDGKINLS